MCQSDCSVDSCEKIKGNIFFSPLTQLCCDCRQETDKAFSSSDPGIISFTTFTLQRPFRFCSAPFRGRL